MRLETVYLEIPGELLEPVKTFYCDQLALALVTEEPGHSIWLDGQGVRLGFHADETSALDRGAVNLSFAVEDTDAELERLRAAGVPVVQEPMDAPWDGSRVAVIADPAGHSVWLTAPRVG